MKMYKTLHAGEKVFPLKLDLQTFADEGEQNNEEQNQNNQDDQQDKEPTFDELLKDKSMQSEFDRRIDKAIETAREKWQTEHEEKLERAKTEAEKLAKMNAEQRAEHERQQREDELAKREADITRRELRASTIDELVEKGLPISLADIINYTDADSTKASIEAVEKAFRQAVEDGVNERLKGNPPRGGGGGGKSEDNPWDYDNLNLTKQGQILRDDPDLAARLQATAKKKKE